ncbi:hypothetical protein MTO96_013514 [Rhipicephalus appendiculatus]
MPDVKAAHKTGEFATTEIKPCKVLVKKLPDVISLKLRASMSGNNDFTLGGMFEKGVLKSKLIVSIDCLTTSELPQTKVQNSQTMQENTLPGNSGYFKPTVVSRPKTPDEKETKKRNLSGLDSESNCASENPVPEKCIPIQDAIHQEEGRVLRSQISKPSVVAVAVSRGGSSPVQSCWRHHHTQHAHVAHRGADKLKTSLNRRLKEMKSYEPPTVAASSLHSGRSSSSSHEKQHKTQTKHNETGKQCPAFHSQKAKKESLSKSSRSAKNKVLLQGRSRPHQDKSFKHSSLKKTSSHRGKMSRSSLSKGSHVQKDCEEKPKQSKMKQANIKQLPTDCGIDNWDCTGEASAPENVCNESSQWLSDSTPQDDIIVVPDTSKSNSSKRGSLEYIQIKQEPTDWGTDDWGCSGEASAPENVCDKSSQWLSDSTPQDDIIVVPDTSKSNSSKRGSLEYIQIKQEPTDWGTDDWGCSGEASAPENLSLTPPRATASKRGSLGYIQIKQEPTDWGTDDWGCSGEASAPENVCDKSSQWLSDSTPQDDIIVVSDTSKSNSSKRGSLDYIQIKKEPADWGIDDMGCSGEASAPENFGDKASQWLPDSTQQVNKMKPCSVLVKKLPDVISLKPGAWIGLTDDLTLKDIKVTYNMKKQANLPPFLMAACKDDAKWEARKTMHVDESICEFKDYGGLFEREGVFKSKLVVSIDRLATSELAQQAKVQNSQTIEKISPGSSGSFKPTTVSRPKSLDHKSALRMLETKKWDVSGLVSDSNCASKNGRSRPHQDKSVKHSSLKKTSSLRGKMSRSSLSKGSRVQKDHEEKPKQSKMKQANIKQLPTDCGIDNWDCTGEASAPENVCDGSSQWLSDSTPQDDIIVVPDTSKSNSSKRGSLEYIQIKQEPTDWGTDDWGCSGEASAPENVCDKSSQWLSDSTPQDDIIVVPDTSKSNSSKTGSLDYIQIKQEPTD